MSPSNPVRILALLALMVPAIASARYAPDPACPWTFSVTGTETASSLALDREGKIWVAGNRVWGGQDAILMWWNCNNPVGPLYYYLFNPTGLDEGIPSISIDWHQPLAKITHEDLWISFTASRAGEGGNMFFYKFFDAFFDVTDDVLVPFEFNSGFSESLAGASVRSLTEPAMLDPSGVGTVNKGGVDMLEFVRYKLEPGNVYSTHSATVWNPSGTAIYGKACVRGDIDTTWAVGQTATAILLVKYSADNLSGCPVPVPGFPVYRTEAAPVDVRAAVRDVSSNLWVAGRLGASAAVWKFSRDGVLASGFPVSYSSPAGAGFNALAFDEDAVAYAVGYDGEEMLLAGISQAGALVSTTLFDAQDSVEGRAIGVGGDRAIWIAATITAGASSTIWAGSQIGLYRYSWSRDPSPAEIEDFVLRAPRGGLLDLAKGEVMPIFANPPRAGDVKFEILTMRGEVVRDFTVQSGGGRTISVVWDGRNSAGEPVAAGVYAIRVNGGGVKGLKRAVVVRSKK